MKKRIKKVIFIISILTICLFGYYFLNKYFKFSIPCLFNKLTGYLCPGCGITRSLFSIIEGKFKQAFHYNALIFILLFPFGLYTILNIIKYIKGDPYLKVPPVIVNTLLIITILFGIIRNIL